MNYTIVKLVTTLLRLLYKLEENHKDALPLLFNSFAMLMKGYYNRVCIVIVADLCLNYYLASRLPYAMYANRSC